MDEAPPPEELDLIEAIIAAARPPEMLGYHKLRARRAGARRWIDLHVQFKNGTSLERAHEAAHELRDAIRGRAAALGRADPRRAGELASRDAARCATPVERESYGD